MYTHALCNNIYVHAIKNIDSIKMNKFHLWVPVLQYNILHYSMSYASLQHSVYRRKI